MIFILFSVLRVVGPGAWLAELQLSLIGTYSPILSILFLLLPLVFILEFVGRRVSGISPIPRFHFSEDSLVTIFGLGLAAVISWISLQQLVAQDLGEIEASAENAARISNAYATVIGITNGEFVAIEDRGVVDYFIPIFDQDFPTQPAAFVVLVNSNKAEDQLDWKVGTRDLVSTKGHLQTSITADRNFLLRRELGDKISRQYLAVVTNVTQRGAWKGIPFAFGVALGYPTYIRIRKWWFARRSKP
jgi:regulator of protease activity HflC (stomatin/prohibitin superfamily)